MSELRRPMQSRESVLWTDADWNARIEHELHDLVPSVSAGIEERGLALLGGRIGEQSLDRIEASEAGGAFQIEFRAARGQIFRGLFTSIRQATPHRIAGPELEDRAALQQQLQQ